MEKIKAIFFDLDGVLSSDNRGFTSICRNLAVRSDLKFDELVKFYEPLLERVDKGIISVEELCQLINDEFSSSVGPEDIIEAASSTPINEPILSIAKSLKDLELVVGIITDNPRWRIDSLAKKLSLKDTFDPIVCSADVKCRKESHDSVNLYARALKSHQLKPNDCIYIDDKAPNLDTPEAMGFHTYYYDSELNDKDALIIYLSGFGFNVL